MTLLRGIVYALILEAAVIALLYVCVRAAGTADAKYAALLVLLLWPISVVVGRERR